MSKAWLQNGKILMSGGAVTLCNSCPCDGVPIISSDSDCGIYFKNQRIGHTWVVDPITRTEPVIVFCSNEAETEAFCDYWFGRSVSLPPYLLTSPPHFCWWLYHDEVMPFCGGTTSERGFWRLAVEGPTYAIIRVTMYTVGTSYVSYEILLEDFDSVGPNTLTRRISGSNTCGFPDAITIQPTGGVIQFEEAPPTVTEFSCSDPTSYRDMYGSVTVNLNGSQTKFVNWKWPPFSRMGWRGTKQSGTGPIDWAIYGGSKGAGCSASHLWYSGSGDFTQSEETDQIADIYYYLGLTNTDSSPCSILIEWGPDIS